MYQSIDDPQEELDALERGDKRMVIWLCTVLCLGLVFLIVYWTSPGPRTETPKNDVLRAEQITYRKAISEMGAPMRRARLQDFITTYPESRYMRAVEAQLDVINRHETQKWTQVTDIAFSSRYTKDDKLAAIDAFEAQWGGALLGGRDSEIKDLRAEIMETIDAPKTPSRKLTNLKSPIPKTVPDTQLAGGPRPVAPPAIIRPVTPQPELEKTVELEVIAPIIRKRVEPRYPRKALRRDIEATVTVSLNIDEKGKVAMAEVVDVKAERYKKDFIKAAERAAMRTRFHPKTVGGKAQAATNIRMRYRFDPKAVR